MDMLKELYIDPGTGGMIFTVLFGIFGVAVFSLRALLIRMKFAVGGGKNDKTSNVKMPIVFFCEHKRYWLIFEPILEELEKRGQKVVYITCSKDDPVFDRKYRNVTCEYIGEGNKAYSRLNVLNASVVFSTTPSLDVFQWKRSKNVDCYIHIMHAAKDLTLYRMYGTDHYDALILSGEYQIEQARELERMRGIPARDIALCGVPYMDEMKKRLEAAGPVPEHARTVLLAPSWGESGILSRFGERLIDSLISTGYRIIIRPHPQSFVSEKEMLKRYMTKYSDPSKVEWNRDTDNFEVLRQSDILISDFSGVMFEFSFVFDKPIIYTDTRFDVRPYDADWIDETPWTFRVLPELGIELKDDNVDNIKSLIDECIEDSSYRKGREKARSEIWVNIGEGAARSADFIISEYNKTVSRRRPKERRTERSGKSLFGKVGAKKKEALH